MPSKDQIVAEPISGVEAFEAEQKLEEKAEKEAREVFDKLSGEYREAFPEETAKTEHEEDVKGAASEEEDEEGELEEDEELAAGEEDEEEDEEDEEDGEDENDNEAEDEEEGADLSQAFQALRRLGFTAKRLDRMSDKEILKAGSNAKLLLDSQASAHAQEQQNGNGKADAPEEEGGAATPSAEPSGEAFKDNFKEFLEYAGFGDEGDKRFLQGMEKAAGAVMGPDSPVISAMNGYRTMVADVLQEVHRARLQEADPRLKKSGPWTSVMNEVVKLANTGAYEGDVRALFDHAHRIVRGEALEADDTRTRSRKRKKRARGTAGDSGKAGSGRGTAASTPLQNERALFDRIQKRYHGGRGGNRRLGGRFVEGRDK